MNYEHADLILSKARKALASPCYRELFNEAVPQPQQGVTNERLQAAFDVLATIISIHGDQYLPLFKRLHSELENRKENDQYTRLARTIHEQKFKT